MELKMYQNKCRTCGTTTLSRTKAMACEACGSDDIAHSRQCKQIDVKRLIANALIGAAVVGGILAFVLM